MCLQHPHCSTDRSIFQHTPPSRAAGEHTIRGLARSLLLGADLLFIRGELWQWQTPNPAPPPCLAFSTNNTAKAEAAVRACSSDSPFLARWHQTKEAGASSLGAARTHRPGRAGLPDWKRLSRNSGPGGGQPSQASALTSAPRNLRSPAAALPAAPFPNADKPHTRLLRDAAGGLCGLEQGRLLVLSSSPGWARSGCGAVAGSGLACSSWGNAGVWASADGAGMRLGRSSEMRCFAQPHYSFSPEEGGGSGRAPFSCSSCAHWPSRSLLLLRVRAPRPALLGREHPPRLRPEPFLYLLRTQLPLCIWLEQIPKPPQSPAVVVWR